MIFLLKKECEMIHAYYYGISKMRIIWEKELDAMVRKNIVRKVIEVVDEEYNEIWYYVRDINENSYIVKNRVGRNYGYRLMNKYKKKLKFYRIGTNVIQIIDNGVFPIVAKVRKEKFFEYYNKVKNISDFCFNNYYCEDNDMFFAVKSFRNKVEYKEFDNELDTVKWCNDLDHVSKSKSKDLLSSIYIDIN